MEWEFIYGVLVVYLVNYILGKLIVPGKTEVEQLYKIFELCDSPFDDFGQNFKLPNASMVAQLSFVF